MWNLKNYTNVSQNRNRLMDLEKELMVTRQEGWGRGTDLGVWD